MKARTRESAYEEGVVVGKMTPGWTEKRVGEEEMGSEEREEGSTQERDPAKAHDW